MSPLLQKIYYDVMEFHIHRFDAISLGAAAAVAAVTAASPFGSKWLRSTLDASFSIQLTSLLLQARRRSVAHHHMYTIYTNADDTPVTARVFVL